MLLLILISQFAFGTLDTNEYTRKDAKKLEHYYIGLYYPKFANHYKQHPKALKYKDKRVFFHTLKDCNITLITDNSLIIRDVVLHNKECNN